MNHLFLVRHGENLANLTKEFSHKSVDYSLTEKGILQAQQTAEYFRQQRVDAIYASPLKRASETAAIIAQVLGLPYTVLEDLREVNVGSLEGQPATMELWEQHNQIIGDWLDGDLDRAFPDGEDGHSLRLRFARALVAILQNRLDQSIVVVGHGGMFTFALPQLCPDVEMSWIRQRQSQNCSISQVRVSRQNGSWRGELLAWAEDAHMSGPAADFVSGFVNTRK